MTVRTDIFLYTEKLSYAPIRWWTLLAMGMPSTTRNCLLFFTLEIWRRGYARTVMPENMLSETDIQDAYCRRESHFSLV